VITSDGGLLAYRELDDVLALTENGGERLAEARTGKNRRHLLVGLLRQSVLGRLGGYEDVNDAERLCRDPAMRWVVGGGAPLGRAASASQMGRFETECLARAENLTALADLPGIGSTPCTGGDRRRASRSLHDKVEWDSGELCPRVGFIVTSLARPAERIVDFHNHRRTCE
jgi:hypothetical protein